LADALPERVMAPGSDGLWDTHISGEDRGGKHFSYTWFSAGGTGALIDKDGMSATAYPSGIAGVPIEVIETLSPLVVRRRELRVNSGGAGAHRGGLGQTMEFEVLTNKEFLFSGLYDRTKFAAPGLSGGQPGTAGELRSNPDRNLRPKISEFLPSDTVVTLEMPGGGGFGDPLSRRVDLVLHDVKNGYVTADSAKRDYGVVIDADASEIDAEATERLRAKANSK